MRIQSAPVFAIAADDAQAINSLAASISYTGEGVRVVVRAISVTVARIRSLGAAISFRGGAIKDRGKGVRVLVGAIREMMARIRSLVTVISEHGLHVQHAGSLKRETRQEFSVQGRRDRLQSERRAREGVPRGF
jgi:hypothetical protein